jgi:hypothetical protein
MNRLGQIWVETAIYTLIAFILIGAVLAFAKPKIDEMRDKAIIEQSINMLKEIDNTITYLGIPGNQRAVSLSIRDGTLEIDAIQDVIIFELETSHQYSEDGIEVDDEGLKIITLRESGLKKVRIISNYSEIFNLTIQDKQEVKPITKSPTSYKLIIRKGDLDHNNRSFVDFKIN